MSIDNKIDIASLAIFTVTSSSMEILVRNFDQIVLDAIFRMTGRNTQGELHKKFLLGYLKTKK